VLTLGAAYSVAALLTVIAVMGRFSYSFALTIAFFRYETGHKSTSAIISCAKIQILWHIIIGLAILFYTLSKKMGEMLIIKL
jgi:hypothetical protein